MEKTSLIHGKNDMYWNEEVKAILEQTQVHLRESMARQEIGMAIAAVKRRDGEEMGSIRAEIQELPSMPEYSYTHTCARCGCHTVSESYLPGAGFLRVCGWCGHMHGIGGW